MSGLSAHPIAEPALKLPRLGFAGTGWIGRSRMETLVQSGAARAAAIFDPASECMARARECAPGAYPAGSFEEMLSLDLDGIVIATPSAMHAEQCIAALKQGLAVFCQKPLARTAPEAARVVEAARRANRLLRIDLSYRYTEGIAKIRELIRGGALGRIYAADLVFHNAYGPDKEWYYRPELSGGGCVIDLGIHLADLALWMLDFPRIGGVDSALYSRGERLSPPIEAVEDYGVASFTTESGVSVRLACSWRLPTAGDAVIGACFYGTGGGAEFRNVDGSFYDFAAVHVHRRERIQLCSPPDQWGGRALLAWAQKLSRDGTFERETERLVSVARVLDAIYAR